MADNSGPQPLSFAVSSDDRVDTRGVARNVLSGAFGVIGAEYSGAWDGSETPTLMFNDAVIGSDGDYKTSMAYVPDANKRFSFFAYYPYSNKIERPTNPLHMETDEDTPGFPYFTYQVPADVSKQEDIMVAMAHQTYGTDVNGRIINRSTGEEERVQLQFHHLLAAVRFKVNNDFDKGRITRLALTNLDDKGVFAYGAESATPGEYDYNWAEKPTHKNTFYVNLDFALTGKGEVNGTGDTNNLLDLTDVDETFLLIPQTLNTGVKIQITYTNGVNEFNLEYPIGLKTKSNPITLERSAITTFYLYIDAIHRINAKVSITDWNDGYTFDGGVSDQDQIDLGTVIKDWDDEDSNGDSTTKDIQTGAQD